TRPRRRAAHGRLRAARNPSAKERIVSMKERDSPFFRIPGPQQEAFPALAKKLAYGFNVRFSAVLGHDCALLIFASEHVGALPCAQLGRSSSPKLCNSMPPDLVWSCPILCDASHNQKPQRRPG